MGAPRIARLRALSASDTGRAAELGVAAMVGNVVALAFTLVFTRVLGQSGYGSLGALLSTFLILTVPGYALQTTVAREVSAALVAGDPDAGAGVRRWLRRLIVVAIAGTVVAALGRNVLASVIAVRDVPWGAAATVPAASLWLILSVERGALLGFQRYRLVGVSIVAEQSARLLFGVILAVAGLDVTGAFLGTPLAFIAICSALWMPLHRQVPHMPLLEIRGHRLRDLLARAWAPICALGLISWLQDGHVIVVKHLASSKAAGAWVAAGVAAKAIMWVAIGLASYLVPEVARRARAGTDPRGILLRTMGLVCCVAVPMVLVYAVAARPVLRQVLHVKGGEGALPFLGLALAMLAMSYLATQYQLGLHRSRFIVALVIAGVAQPLILLVIGANLTGLALGVLAVQACLAAVMLSVALRRAPRVSAAEPELVEEPTAALTEA